jgi:hypothetical protein
MPTLIPSQCRRRVFNGKRNSDDGHGVRCQRHVHADRLRLVSRFPEGRRRRRFIQPGRRWRRRAVRLRRRLAWWPVSPTRSPLALVARVDRSELHQPAKTVEVHLWPMGRSLSFPSLVAMAPWSHLPKFRAMADQGAVPLALEQTMVMVALAAPVVALELRPKIPGAGQRHVAVISPLL